jgi:hypothetical protein
MDDIDRENEIYNRMYEKNAHARAEILKLQDELVTHYQRLCNEYPRKNPS